VFLYDPERRTALLVRQPRAPCIEVQEDGNLLEAVAGSLDGKSPEATARAEALEEAGVELSAIEHVATIWTMPAVSTERMYLFIAPYTPASRVTRGGGAVDENECIVVEEVPLAQLRLMADAGELTDGKTYTLLQALRLKEPALFT
jgi:nudix-type nucleoside diphosphatase (YffH/AdpP family)